MFEPVAFSGNRHDTRVVQQAIKQRSGQRGILGEGRIPLAEGQIAGNDQAAFFVAGCNDLDEQVGLLPGHWEVSNFVNDEQAVAVDGSMHDVFELILDVRSRQCQQQSGGRGKSRLDPGLRRPVTQGDRQMRLAHARGADEHHILTSLDKAQSGQLLNLAALHALGKLIVEVVQRLDRGEAGQAGEHDLLSHVASRGLHPEEPLEEIAIGSFLSRGILCRYRVEPQPVPLQESCRESYGDSLLQE